MKDERMHALNSRWEPETAMILAAGLGTRLRPITNDMPKPLVRVAGKTLIDYGLDALEAAGIQKTVVNVHYLADQIVAHLKHRGVRGLEISDERECLMDSGGGVKKALPLIGNKPFFLLNGDSFWLEGFKSNLKLLCDSWDASKMDILLLLTGFSSTVGYDGNGDFDMDSEGRLSRRSERKIAPFVYAGAAILDAKVFENTPDSPFSLNMLFDRAIAEDRLFGARMDGLWLHVGTPEAISEAESAIARSAA